jgi:hypothetical protein
MKKFKTRKEILECPEFAKLAFELLLEELPNIPDDTSVWDDELGFKVEKFIERKINQCKYQGV